MKKLFGIAAVLVAALFIMVPVVSAQDYYIPEGGTSADAYAGSTAGAFLDARDYSHNINNVPRGYVVPGDVVYPGIPNLFFPPVDKGPQYLKESVVTKYKTSWTAEELAVRADGKNIKIITDAPVVPEDKRAAVVVYKGDQRVVKQVDILCVYTDGEKANSEDVFEEAAAKARAIGANAIEFIGDGVTPEMKTSGWGIGFNVTGAAIAGGEQATSILSSGGTGYSTGKAKYNKLPWGQFYALVVE